MSSIRSRSDSDLLFIDFRFQGLRCRELTLMSDSPANRKSLQKILSKIEAEIAAGTFIYANYFPTSKALKRFAEASSTATQSERRNAIELSPAGHDAPKDQPPNPQVTQSRTFRSFATQWFDGRCIEWRRSHIRSLQSTLNGRLLPYFGDKDVGSISKSDVLEFRAELAKVKGRGNQEGLSSKRINEIMGLLGQIMNEAADQYEFKSPMANIKKLRQRRSDVNPFSLVDVQNILATVRPDYIPYFTVRFFTGMRTGEVHGLKWKYVDFERRSIAIRETFVLGEDEYTKTDAGQRDIQMSQPVWEALRQQRLASEQSDEYVFGNRQGQPLDNKNFSDRVWYPLLRNLGLEPRRPYQMRHTAATLWLASGEAPEWIARQLGHASTEMLFRVYSRYVPNLTRQDGSAMERLLARHLATGALMAQNEADVLGARAGTVINPSRSTESTLAPVTTSPTVYVTAQEVIEARSAPKPLTGSRQRTSPAATGLNTKLQLDATQTLRSATRAENRIAMRVPGLDDVTKAQPPPLNRLVPAITWADLATHWQHASQAARPSTAASP